MQKSKISKLIKIYRLNIFKCVLKNLSANSFNLKSESINFNKKNILENKNKNKNYNDYHSDNNKITIVENKISESPNSRIENSKIEDKYKTQNMDSNNDPTNDQIKNIIKDTDISLLKSESNSKSMLKAEPNSKAKSKSRSKHKSKSKCKSKSNLKCIVSQKEGSKNEEKVKFKFKLNSKNNSNCVSPFHKKFSYSNIKINLNPNKGQFDLPFIAKSNINSRKDLTKIGNPLSLKIENKSHFEATSSRHIAENLNSSSRDLLGKFIAKKEENTSRQSKGKVHLHDFQQFQQFQKMEKLHKFQKDDSLNNNNLTEKSKSICEKNLKEIFLEELNNLKMQLSNDGYITRRREKSELVSRSES